MTKDEIDAARGRLKKIEGEKERNADIRARWNQGKGETQRSLAVEYGISVPRVFQICHNKPMDVRRDLIVDDLRKALDALDRVYEAMKDRNCADIGFGYFEYLEIDEIRKALEGSAARADGAHPR